MMDGKNRRMKMKGKLLTGTVVILALVAGMFVAPQTMLRADEDTLHNDDVAKYVFYFIGDGLGAAQRQLAEYYVKETRGEQAQLMINHMPVSAMNTTHSMNTLITDSAAAGTALATGHKTNNGYIAMTPDGEAIETLVEKAEKIGKATGVATTTRITHATPAVFISHNEDRDDENAIAADYLDSGVDYLVGGGVRHFLPKDWKDAQKDVTGSTIKSKRNDNQNLIQAFKDKGYLAYYGEKGAKAFDDYTPKAGERYVNLFASSHMPYSIDAAKDEKVPTLAEITQKGIELLSKDDDGFFFMIEGGRIDHACHPNDARGAIDDTIAFDDAVKEAYDFYMEHPKETLIVVVGDHETGGLGLGVNTDYFMNLDQLEAATMSIEAFMYSDQAYKGDRKAFIETIGRVFGLTQLTDEEMAILNKGMDMQDAGVYDVGNAYQYDESAEAVAHILSERAGVYWTSYAHTGTQIPMSAIGVGATDYSGFMDNTDIAKKTAIHLGVTLQ